MNFFTIFGTLCACIQKPFRWLTDRHTDLCREANRKDCRAHIKHQKGPQGTYKMTKKTAGRCALPNKPRVSTIPDDNYMTQSMTWYNNIAKHDSFFFFCAIEIVTRFKNCKSRKLRILIWKWKRLISYLILWDTVEWEKQIFYTQKAKN